MAKRRVLKTAISSLSAPLVAMAKLSERLGILKVDDLERCLKIVDNFGDCVPSVFLNALVVAEDHRNAFHPGIDPIGILRAIVVRFSTGEIQGASTIEQQFVRVVTCRYERSFSRKIREQMLAIALSRRRPKKAIASAYLSIAFYGSGLRGLDGLRQWFGDDLSSVGSEDALRFVSQLKYPRPPEPTSDWYIKIARRVGYLINDRQRKANNALQRTPRTAERRYYV